jgi:hypothetical protein
MKPFCGDTKLLLVDGQRGNGFLYGLNSWLSAYCRTEGDNAKDIYKESTVLACFYDDAVSQSVNVFVRMFVDIKAGLDVLDKPLLKENSVLSLERELSVPYNDAIHGLL